ncbi:uncharacterized protein PG986_010062 [Apiospora aurea]|uniref:Uncharacterized protein n=1 Tax=Apiospora aurea TaxID=335848 RepID=A0ABR1Q9E4_9PEZI
MLVWSATQTLKEVAAKERILVDKPANHYRHSLKVLELVQNDFSERLGGSTHIDGMTSGHSSRFARFDTNGLWQFSPVLCGAALLEALDISHSLGIGIWDETAEPILMMHVHNMLLQMGYIEEPIEVYSKLPEMFYPEMFQDGKPPLSGIAQSMLDHIDSRFGKAPSKRPRSTRRQVIPKSATEAYRMLDSDSFQRRKPGNVLGMWRRASWNPDRIPDEEVVFSLLIGVRLAQTKHVVDPRTGETKLEETPLVSMVLKDNPNALEDLLEGSKSMREVLFDPADPVPEDLPAHIRDNYQFETALPRLSDKVHSHASSFIDININSRKLLSLVKWDLNGDILDGQSGLNVVRLAVHFVLTFRGIEKALSEIRNETYIRVYESGNSWNRPKPVVLARMALEGHDQGCLRTMARVLEGTKDGVEDFKYWKDVGEASKPNIDSVASLSPWQAGLWSSIPFDWAIIPSTLGTIATMLFANRLERRKSMFVGALVSVLGSFPTGRHRQHDSHAHHPPLRRERCLLDNNDQRISLWKLPPYIPVSRESRTKNWTELRGCVLRSCYQFWGELEFANPNAKGVDRSWLCAATFDGLGLK